jgi:hypothetical protein
MSYLEKLLMVRLPLNIVTTRLLGRKTLVGGDQSDRESCVFEREA